jgi:hypothetical protein
MKSLFHSVILASSTLLVFSFVSCKEKKNSNEYYTPREITAATDVPKYDLKLNRIDLECFGVHDIIAVDSMIVAITSNKESMIQVFDYSGNPIAMLSPSGRAGNEFLQVHYTDQNTVIDGDRYLYVGDFESLYLYNLSGSIRNGANLKPQKLMEMPDYRDRASSFNILFRNDGSYFQYTGVTYNEIEIPGEALAVNPDGSLSLKDGYRMPEFEFNPPTYKLIKPDGSTTQFDIYPKLPDFKNPHRAHNLYHSTVRLSNDGRKVVVVDAYQDRMTFIDLETGDMFGVRCPDFVDFAKYADDDDFSSKVVEGVWQVVTNGKHIYVLYDHNTIYEEDEEDKPIDPSIRVFNWDGEFIADLIPDAPIDNFFIDDKTGKLIATDDDEQFYTADLQEVIKDVSRL